MQYIYVNQNGVKAIKHAGVILHSDLKNKVGIQDTECELLLVYRQFSSQLTVIICDKDAAVKNLPIMGITRQGMGIKGNFVIASLVPYDSTGKLAGMSQARTEIALREIKLVRQ